MQFYSGDSEFPPLPGGALVQFSNKRAPGNTSAAVAPDSRRKPSALGLRVGLRECPRRLASAAGSPLTCHQSTESHVVPSDAALLPGKAPGLIQLSSTFGDTVSSTGRFACLAHSLGVISGPRVPQRAAAAAAVPAVRGSCGWRERKVEALDVVPHSLGGHLDFESRRNQSRGVK